MTEAEIRQAVRESLAKVASDADLETLDPHVSFHDQFGLDSVDFMEFVAELQRRLGITVSDFQAVRLSSLEGCLRFLAPAVAASPD